MKHEREKVIEDLKEMKELQALYEKACDENNVDLINKWAGYIVDRSFDIVKHLEESAGYIAHTNEDAPGITRLGSSRDFKAAPTQEPTDEEIEAFKNSPAKKTLDKLYNQIVDLVKMQSTPVKVFEPPIQEPYLSPENRRIVEKGIQEAKDGKFAPDPRKEPPIQEAQEKEWKKYETMEDLAEGIGLPRERGTEAMKKAPATHEDRLSILEKKVELLASKVWTDHDEVNSEDQKAEWCATFVNETEEWKAIK